MYKYVCIQRQTSKFNGKLLHSTANFCTQRQTSALNGKLLKFNGKLPELNGKIPSPAAPGYTGFSCRALLNLNCVSKA